MLCMETHKLCQTLTLLHLWGIGKKKKKRFPGKVFFFFFPGIKITTSLCFVCRF